MKSFTDGFSIESVLLGGHISMNLTEDFWSFWNMNVEDGFDDKILKPKVPKMRSRTNVKLRIQLSIQCDYIDVKNN